MKVAIFSVVILVSNYHGRKGEAIKINTALCDRYYFQNCKAITFTKLTDYGKYKQPNVPTYLHIY